MGWRGISSILNRPPHSCVAIWNSINLNVKLMYHHLYLYFKRKKTKNFDKLQNNQSTYLLKHQQNKYFFLRYSTYFYGGISTSKKHSSLSVWWVLRKCIECCHGNVVLQNPTRFSHLYLTWWTSYLMWNISCLWE